MNYKAVDQLRKLSQKILDYDFQEVAEYVLSNELFPKWTASSHPNVHHYGDGGLATHTLEVTELCLLNNKYFKKIEKGVDDKIIFLAALFHDIGKIRDYELYDVNEGKGEEPFDWQYRSGQHKFRIHHISASALMWTEAMMENKMMHEETIYEEVLHAILAHHGRREWGSPVTPQTGVAWLLHLSDNMSARMDDNDKPKADHHKPA